jgi:hypothetical protein
MLSSNASADAVISELVNSATKRSNPADDSITYPPPSDGDTKEWSRNASRRQGSRSDASSDLTT